MITLSNFSKKGIKKFVKQIARKTLKQEGDYQDILYYLDLILSNIDRLSEYKMKSAFADYQIVEREELQILKNGYISSRISEYKKNEDIHKMKSEDAKKEIEKIADKIQKEENEELYKIQQEILKSDRYDKNTAVTNDDKEIKKLICEFLKENGVKKRSNCNLKYTLIPELIKIDGYEKFLKENNLKINTNIYGKFLARI